MIPRWRTSLAAVEAKLPALLGDSLLAVSAAVYLGPLDGGERAAVLGLWRDLLAARGVPVGPAPFEFSAFVSDRFTAMTAGLPPELLANTQPLWRDNLALMALASRPPLLLDPGREGANLVKAMFGKAARVFMTISEEGLLDKVGERRRTGAGG
jgi:dynein heavy chain